MGSFGYGELSLGVLVVEMMSTYLINHLSSKLSVNEKLCRGFCMSLMGARVIFVIIS